MTLVNCQICQKFTVKYLQYTTTKYVCYKHIILLINYYAIEIHYPTLALWYYNITGYLRGIRVVAVSYRQYMDTQCSKTVGPLLHSRFFHNYPSHVVGQSVDYSV